MKVSTVLAARIEAALESAVAPNDCGSAPPRVAAAIRHALFPAGSRIRPRLCLAVATACGDPDPALADAAAAALEMVHCASLVHDDLPCFDDAAMRRGRPSVHRAFGEREAVLAGDALIVMAFGALSRHVARRPAAAAALLAGLAESLALPAGIIGGQGWECEAAVDLRGYHAAKTGALFVAATAGGAAAADSDPQPWRELGERLGEAYQVADDIRDATASEEALGKPVRRDAALARPSAVAALGLPRALWRFNTLIAAAADSVPPCAGQSALRHLIHGEARRLIPDELAREAA